MDVAGVTAGAMEVAAGRGKGVSGAPGQLAKAAVQEAQVAGAELLKNAQGIAASSIAKGADPASVFSALIPEPVADTPDGTPDTVPDGEGATEADAAAGSEVPVSAKVVDSDEAASDTVTSAGDAAEDELVGDASGAVDDAVSETGTGVATEGCVARPGRY